MSIQHGSLVINGERVENTGSMTICYYCSKTGKCEAHQVGFEITINAHGIPAKAKFSDVMMVSQILACPINQFDYHSSR